MAEATTARPIDRRPWLDAFMADPASELDNLLSGHARIEPYEGADAPDAARLLFGGLPEEDDVRVVLDKALCKWLDSQRMGGVPELGQLPLERWVRKVSEAFEIIGFLKLRHCSLNLRQRFIVWNSWVDRLVISDHRDGRRVFWRTLALTQRLVADGNSRMSPLALEPFWLRMCEHSGTAFPANYLAVGLLGLRMLPEREGAPLERPWMAGLVRWAIAQEPTIEEFSQQWWALKGLYPRMPSYWRRVVDETLQQSLAKQFPDELKDWWRQDVNAKDGTTTQKSLRRPAGVPHLPSRDTNLSLLKRATDPFLSIADQIKAHIYGYQHFAEATGDSFYIVRSACNIGMAVIKGADDPVGRGQLAVQLARQALSWQPTNPFAWSLWRDALVNQGAFEAAERVGWEAIRRIPEDVHKRTQLALLLARLPDRETDAEQLLRETIERFPDNVIARNQLAELLIALGRENEATRVVDDIFLCGLEDEAGFDLRARLLYHSGDVEATRNVLGAGIECLQTSPVLQAHLQMLDNGKELPLKSTAFRLRDIAVETAGATVADTAETVGAAVWRGGCLRRLYHDSRRRQDDDQWRRGALEEVRRVLSEDPNLAYAEYLRRELEGRDGDGLAGESFATAFVDAVKRKDADCFSRLEKSISGQLHLVDVAKAFLFADQPAADRALIWLRQEARSEPRTVSALRGFLRQRLDISSIESGNAFVKLIADNDNIKTDLIEAAFAGDELLLAA